MELVLGRTGALDRNARLLLPCCGVMVQELGCDDAQTPSKGMILKELMN